MREAHEHSRPWRAADPYENLEGGTQLFPHVYGPLVVSAVVEVLEFPPREDGRFVLPAKLQ